MINVRIYSVNTCEVNVSHEDRQFESYDEMFDEIIEEYGDEDVNGDSISELYKGSDEVIVEGDVYFVKYEVL